MSAISAVRAPARIGPNAITRIAEALTRRCGEGTAVEVFAFAGLAAYLREPPQGMVDEEEARRLHGTLRARLGERAAEVSRDAGLATAEYLLAHRIPKRAQWLLVRLPARLACRLLLAAIARHAWTFAGSGTFEAMAGRPAILTIRDNPLCRGVRTSRPACDYYAATFERLFQVLVHPASRATEVRCEARGDDACVFELRW